MLSALTTLAQNYDYTYTVPTSSSVDGGLSGAVLAVLGIGGFAVAILAIAGMWKVFTKAGKPGWASIIPIYNYYILLQIVGRPTWWLLLLLVSVVPVVGAIVALVVSIIVANDLSKSFGRGVGMTILLVVLPFIGYPILGFGDAKYGGPSVTPQGGGAATPTHPTPPTEGTTPPPVTPAV